MNKQKLPYALLFLSALLLSELLEAQNEGLSLRWETARELSVPESILAPGNGQILVSNISGKPTEKDGNGFISVLNSDGQILIKDWAVGLDAPKGMVRWDQFLYVTDIDQIVKIDGISGKILKKIPVEGAQFLNDLVVVPDGRIFCSDMMTHKIHILFQDRITYSVENVLLKNPNGLLLYEGSILVGCNDNILQMHSESAEISIFLSGTGPVDGLVSPRHGTFIISDWAGKITLLEEGKPSKTLLDTSDENINAADMEWDAVNQLLLVPTFFDHRIRAYELR